MYDSKISSKLLKILRKISKKDKKLYHATLKKISEITQKGPDRYKNLRQNLKEFT